MRQQDRFDHVVDVDVGLALLAVAQNSQAVGSARRRRMKSKPTP